jgi:hypothetical protein
MPKNQAELDAWRQKNQWESARFYTDSQSKIQELQHYCPVHLGPEVRSLCEDILAWLDGGHGRFVVENPADTGHRLHFEPELRKWREQGEALLRRLNLIAASEAQGGDAAQPQDTPQTGQPKRPLSDLQWEVFAILEKETTRCDKYGMPKKCLSGGEIATTLYRIGIRNQDEKRVGDVIREIRQKGWPVENQRGQGYYIPSRNHPE